MPATTPTDRLTSKETATGLVRHLVDEEAIGVDADVVPAADAPDPVVLGDVLADLDAGVLVDEDQTLAQPCVRDEVGQLRLQFWPRQQQTHCAITKNDLLGKRRRWRGQPGI